MYVKFGYISGCNLIFTAFQESGSGRGIAGQPLPEVWPDGYYRAIPLTDLAAGDVVIAYNLEMVYWESDLVYILAPEYVFWEGDRVSYEGDWVIDYDSISWDAVRWTGDVVGAGEYTADLTVGGTSKLDALFAASMQSREIIDDRVKPEKIVILRNL